MIPINHSAFSCLFHLEEVGQSHYDSQDGLKLPISCDPLASVYQVFSPTNTYHSTQAFFSFCTYDLDFISSLELSLNFYSTELFYELS